MTCIVGIEHKGSVWLGGDSAATDNSLQRVIIKDPKVFVKDNVGFGVCGLPKVMDAVAHGIEIPKQSDSQTDRQFLVSVLAPALKAGLEKLDCLADGRHFEGEMLVGYRGKLYQLQGNFQFIRSSTGYNATGSGGSLALGSLSATTGVRDPKKRLLAALEASTANASCAPPFVVVQVKK